MYNLFLKIFSSVLLLFFAQEIMAMNISSDAFKSDSSIPAKYTCDAENISPSLTWSDIPAEAKSLVLIMDDPDAPRGTWDHWIIYNIPTNAKGLPENVKTLPAGAAMGHNSWDKPTYGGPCPPNGEHRYYFKLYALDKMLTLDPGTKKEGVLEAMHGHILGEAELMGRYKRKGQ
jgi:Raf kinase inhibitor-like YbhB/YbcL family protein